MTIQPFLSKLRFPKLPAHCQSATVTVCYSQARAAEIDRSEYIDQAAANCCDLMRLLDSSNLSLGGLSINTGLIDEDKAQMVVTGQDIPSDFLVMILRLVVSLHNTDPTVFANLVEALGSEEEAREVYAGTDFETDVAWISLEIAADTEGQLDPYWLDGQQTPILDQDEIVLSETAMPPEEVEDDLLVLSGLGPFIPIGHVPAHPVGDEEIWQREDDLVIGPISIEPKALGHYVSVLGARQPPELNVSND